MVSIVTTCVAPVVASGTATWTEAFPVSAAENIAFASTVTHVGSVASCPRPVRSDQAVAAASCDRTPSASVLSTPSYCSTRPFVT